MTAAHTTIHDDVEEVLLDADTIARRVGELGAQVAADYAGRSPVLVSVLKGSLVFMADLMRSMDLPCSIDLMELSSYGSGTESSGQVRIIKDLSNSIDGRDVIVVEDIIDTGLTAHYLMDNLQTRKPASVKLCSLLHKPDRSIREVAIDYLGFTIPNKYVVGYGLDIAQRYRNLSFIGYVPQE